MKFTAWAAVLLVAVASPLAFLSFKSAPAVGANSAAGEGVEWITFAEAEKRAAKDNKLLLVDVYTDWCGWCKRLDSDTYSDPAVQAYIREHYHAVKFNAEQKEAIQFKGKDYPWQAGGRSGVNTLAVEMLNGRLAYPTTAFYDDKLSLISPVPGYHGPKEMLAVLKYFKEGVYKSNPNLQAYIQQNAGR